MATERKVSVIVPVYNMQALLPRCVESILGQTYPSVELVLVDDGSKDDSAALCDRFAAQDARVVALHKINSGVADATNMGLDAATGDFLLFVDSDDYIAPDMLERLVKAQEESGADTVQTGMSRVNERGEVTEAKQCEPAVYGTKEGILREFFTGDNILLCLASKLFRREVFDGFRFESGRNIIDILATPFLLQRCDKYQVIDGAPYYAYFRSDSVSRGYMTDKSYNDTLYYLETWKRFLDEYWPDEKAFYAFVQYRACYEASTRYKLLADSPDVTDKPGKLRKMRMLFRENYRKLKRCGYYENYPRRRRLMFWLFSVSPAMMNGASRLKAKTSGRG